MKKAKYIALALLGLVLLIALAFVMELGGLKWAKFFNPRKENVRREVFEATRSYNESKLQDLAKYRLQYIKADDEGKAALRSTIRHMFANYDKDKLPVELASFLYEIRGY